MWILRNLTEDHGGGEGEKKKREGGSQTIRDSLKTENKLRVDGGVGGRGGWAMGVGEGTCWNEPWVLHGSQSDNTFHIKKKIRSE